MDTPHFSSPRTELSGGTAIIVSIPRAAAPGLVHLLRVLLANASVSSFTLRPERYCQPDIPRADIFARSVDHRTKAISGIRLRGKYWYGKRA